MYIAQCKLIWANSFGGYTKNFSIRSNLILGQILSRGSLFFPLSLGEYVVKRYRLIIQLYLLNLLNFLRNFRLDAVQKEAYECGSRFGRDRLPVRPCACPGVVM